jgi:hypothetical protein
VLAAFSAVVSGFEAHSQHLRGLHRMPGGFANLSYNAVAGPPMFAPLLFTAVGLLGFTASLLRRGKI